MTNKFIRVYNTRSIQISVFLYIFNELSGNENNRSNPVHDNFQENGVCRNTLTKISRPCTIISLMNGRAFHIEDNIVKMKILPNQNCRVTERPVRVSTGFAAETERVILKFAETPELRWVKTFIRTHLVSLFSIQKLLQSNNNHECGTTIWTNQMIKSTVQK